LRKRNSLINIRGVPYYSGIGSNSQKNNTLIQTKHLDTTHYLELEYNLTCTPKQWVSKKMQSLKLQNLSQYCSTTQVSNNSGMY
jgi:hypothetical protein